MQPTRGHAPSRMSHVQLVVSQCRNALATKMNSVQSASLVSHHVRVIQRRSALVAILQYHNAAVHCHKYDWHRHSRTHSDSSGNSQHIFFSEVFKASPFRMKWASGLGRIKEACHVNSLYEAVNSSSRTRSLAWGRLVLCPYTTRKAGHFKTTASQ